MDRLTLLRAHVELMAQLREGKPCMDAMLLAHGRVFEGAACPADLSGKPAKQCFKNSLLLMLASPELIYCEGYGMPAEIDFPIHHAWLLDIDGNVVDPTWQNPEGALYVGLPFDPEYMMSLAKRTGYAHVFDNMENIGVFSAAPEEYLHPDFWPSATVRGERDHHIAP